MKIGIITFWDSQDNYGQLLQCWALQSFLKDLGHDPFLIRYKDILDKPIMYVHKSLLKRIWGIFKNPIKIIFYMQEKVNKKKYYTETIRHNRKFDEFRQAHITLSEHIYNSLKELQSNPPEADAYICGSDMIWNEFCCKKAYLLDFGNHQVLRIAYAPSFASSYLSDTYIAKLSHYFNNFNFIGTREKSGVDICKKAGFLHAQWVPDPTLLLNKKAYEHLAIRPSTMEKYLFIYLLGHKTMISLKEIYIFAKERNLRIKYVASQNRVDKYDKIYPTIGEWIGYLQNAEYVFTNSFHCCVLSIIYNKQFLFMPLKKHLSKNNERIDSLLKGLNLVNRKFSNSLNAIEQQIDWKIINELLKEQKQNIFNLIQNIFTNNKEK